MEGVGAERSGTSSKKRPTVLVVEDCALTRARLAAALGDDADYQIVQAVDGADAQRILSTGPVDVVVTDVMMPNLGGLDLLRWAKEECPGATWIIHSALDTFDTAVEALKLGAFDFVPKSFHSVGLIERTVRNALNQRQLVAERERLRLELEQNNRKLEEHVAQLEDVCRILREQAQTIQQDLDRAELIQRVLLPSTVPPMPGFAIDAIYRPSRNIGGDAYDVARLDDRRIALYVADAAGHGVAAAMLSVLLKHRLTMVDSATGTPRAPAQVLTSLNRALLDECAAPGLFVTVAYCVLDLETRELVMAAGGHPPIAFRRANREVTLLERTGPALGLDKDARFDERSITLQVGDRLFLYTDGLCETPAHGKGLTTEAIAGSLAKESGDGQTFLHSLLDAASGPQGGSVEDDVTMLLLTAGDGPSTLDHGAAPAAQTAPSPTPLLASPAAASAITVGTTTDATWVGVHGRGTWIQSAAFQKASIEAQRAGRTLVVDLLACTYLDSTFLGTLHELVGHADEPPVRVQGVRPEVRHLFEELSMLRVLKHIASEDLPAPVSMLPAGETSEAAALSRRRILQAHELLVSLSERNRQQFQGVVDAMRADIQHHA